ncbi:hypothetical protein BDW72DRAFT_213978 [Aspergillus terricola var. indicus]
MELGFCHCHPLSPLPCEQCIFASEVYNARVNLLQDPLPLYAQATRYSDTERTTTHIDPTLWDQAITDGSVDEPPYQQTAYTSVCSGTASNPRNGGSIYPQGHVGCDDNTTFESNEALDTHVKDQHLSTRHALSVENHIM